MAAETTGKPSLVGVDTNLLLDLADENAAAWDALQAMKDRLPTPVFIVPPTVIDELVRGLDSTKPDVARLSKIALENLRAKWRFNPMDFVGVGHGIVEQTAEKIFSQGLIPREEVNDAFVLAESALLDCLLLITSDHHLLDIPHEKLKILLGSCDVCCPLIVSPWKIAEKLSLTKG